MNNLEQKKLTDVQVIKNDNVHVFKFRKDVNCPECNGLPVTFANQGNLCSEHSVKYSVNSKKNIKLRQDRL
jgi:hypothetical protein